MIDPNINADNEISIRKYINDHSEGILFLSNFNNSNSEKLSTLIGDLHYPKNTLCIFSSQKGFKETSKSIIDGNKINVRLEKKSSIICSADYLYAEPLKTTFDPSITQQKYKYQYFAKIYENTDVVGI
jgi:hypothetical protein